MPLLDMIVFVLLFLSAGISGFERSGEAGRLFLASSIAALVAAIGAAWLLRWQIAPALAVAVIASGMAARFLRRPPVRRGAIAAVLVILAGAAALPYIFFPIFDLPKPDGPYGVGVQTLDLRDASRRGVMYTAGDAPRDLPIMVWYPAAAGATGPVRPYLTRRETFDEGLSLAKLWGFPVYRFLSLHSTGTHGIENAPIATGKKFPVVVFSHGYWSIRAQNSALMERLASHGYIVVSVAHPRDSANVRLQNGDLVEVAEHSGPGGVGDPAADARLEAATDAFMGGTDHAKHIAALPAYKAAVTDHRLGNSLVAWRADVLFAAQTLRNRPPPRMAPVFARADFSKTIYAGMSFGGSTAPSACDADPDCVAAVDLDGENFDAAQFDREMRAPLLLLLTDQSFSPAQPKAARVNPTDYAWEKWNCVGDRSDIVRLRARGILHMGMTDFVLSARGPFKSEHFATLDGDRALALVNDAVLAFLDQHVRGARAGTFEATLAKYPELERLDTRSLRTYARGLPGRTACNARRPLPAEREN